MFLAIFFFHIPPHLLEIISWLVFPALVGTMSSPFILYLSAMIDYCSSFFSHSSSFLICHHCVALIAAQLWTDHNTPWIPISEGRWGMERTRGQGVVVRIPAWQQNGERQKLGLVSPLRRRSNSPCMTSISSYTTLYFNLPLCLSLISYSPVYISSSPPFPFHPTSFLLVIHM